MTGAEQTNDRSGTRPWVIVAIIAAAVVGTVVIALTVFLIAGDSQAPTGQPQGDTGQDGPRLLAQTDDSGRFTMSLDLGPDGRAEPDTSPAHVGPGEATFNDGDGVQVRVRSLTLYNDRGAESHVEGLITDYRADHLVECSRTQADSKGSLPGPAVATTGEHLRITATCESDTGQESEVHEIYAFAAEPRRTNAENVAYDWVLVAASGEDAATVSTVLERAVGTVRIEADADAAAASAVAVPADPTTAPARYPTSVWGDVSGFYFPEGWGVVGAGEFTLVAPPRAGADTVRGYASPAIVLTREEQKPGGHQSPDTLSDKALERYSKLATANGCTGHDEVALPPEDLLAEVTWSGCPNGMVDKVVAFDDGTGGVILISARASDEQTAESILKQLLG